MDKDEATFLYIFRGNGKKIKLEHDLGNRGNRDSDYFAA
jgi:hypothetical protein